MPRVIGRLTNTTSTHTDRSRASIVAIIAALALAAAMIFAPRPAVAAHDVTPARAAGETRIETAIAVAGVAFPDGSPEAVVAPANAYTHTLASAALAGALDAPVLLTNGWSLNDTTRDALDAMGVERVTLIGGETVMSADVEAALAERHHVTRIGEDETYASAATIARTTADVTGGLPQLNGLTTVALASGVDFPDALAVSGPAFDGAMPILLTDPHDLSEPTRAALDMLSPQQVLLIGGTDAVSAEVATELEANGHQATRLGGANRTETAAIVADHFIEAGWMTAETTLLARGDAFPDAVTAGQLSGRFDGPIILSATRDLLGENAGAWLSTQCPDIDTLQVIGGTAAVSVEMANGAEGLAESCDPEDPGTNPHHFYEVAPMQPLTPAPSETADFTVARQGDGEPVEGTLDLILFPCANADVLGSNPDTFADTDGDGGADGMGSTDTGQARIAVVNGEDVPDTVIYPASPDEDGDIDIRLSSQAEDCTVLVVVAGDGDGKFDVDADGHPTEDYGVGVAEWR